MGVLIWQEVAMEGGSDSEKPGLAPANVVLSLGILVLVAITASFQGAQASSRRSVALGAGLAFLLS